MKSVKMATVAMMVATMAFLVLQSNALPKENMRMKSEEPVMKMNLMEKDESMRIAPTFLIEGDGRSMAEILAETKSSVYDMSKLKVNPSAASSPSKFFTDRLFGGAKLATNQFLISPNTRFLAVMQDDCNFVVYDSSFNPGKPTWASGTNGRGTTCEVTMQNDGNLVVYEGSTALWASNTYVASGAQNPYTVVMQNDGNLVLYGKATWASNTALTS